MCRELGVPFFSRREDVGQLSQAWRCGVEEAGRRARYAFLEQCRRKVGARWILTAHHAGDLAEDVLMRLARGAAWPGLGGMCGCDSQPGLPLLRPLLMEEKATLRGLLERMHVPWRDDVTNAERIGRRNRVRLDILPLLKAENPAFLDAARRLWRSARQDEAYWRELLAGIFDGNEATEDGLLLRREKLMCLPESARLRAYMIVLERLIRSRPPGCGQRTQGRHSVLFALDRALRENAMENAFSFQAAWKRNFPRGECFSVLFFRNRLLTARFLQRHNLFIKGIQGGRPR